MKRWVAAGVSVVAVTALLAAGALGAFTRSESSAAPAGDAITVKGDWKVTVKSANGRVLRVHRFHNEFNGATTIAPILAHASSTGRYWMTLSDLEGAHPCGADAGAQSCFIFEPDDPNASVAGWFGTLAVSASSDQLIVTGEIEATRSGEFDHVRMLLSRCAATTAPSSCTPGAYGNFSVRTLAAPITLIAGQQAIVTVTYTFSAA
ncbi:MAG TPA: hypothetical protein VF044_02300 [Actinomycetota bacterium]